MKTCSKCGETKPLADFHKKRTSKDGHNSQCKACNTAASVAWQQANPEKAAKRKLDWYRRNKQDVDQRVNAWMSANPERASEIKRRWRKAHPDLCTKHAMDRKAKQISATPSWLSELEKLWMREIYDLAKHRQARFGGKWHVDHIIPLRGKTVCGLHVPWNLQVIPANDNLRKSNKLVAA